MKLAKTITKNPQGCFFSHKLSRKLGVLDISWNVNAVLKIVGKVATNLL